MTSSPASSRHSSRALISPRTSTAKVPTSSRLPAARAPVRLPHQQLHPIALAAGRTRTRGGQRVLAQHLLHLRAQSIERPAQAGRAAGDENPYRPRQRQHVVTCRTRSFTRCSVRHHRLPPAPALDARSVQPNHQHRCGPWNISPALAPSVNTTGFSAAHAVAVTHRRHAGRPAATTSARLSAIPCLSPQTRAASTRYPASPPTLAASAVPALMSSIPTFPWIPSSESILRYRPITGEMELVTRLRL